MLPGIRQDVFLFLVFHFRICVLVGFRIAPGDKDLRVAGRLFRPPVDDGRAVDTHRPLPRDDHDVLRTEDPVCVRPEGVDDVLVYDAVTAFRDGLPDLPRGHVAGGMVRLLVPVRERRTLVVVRERVPDVEEATVQVGVLLVAEAGHLLVEGTDGVVDVPVQHSGHPFDVPVGRAVKREPPAFAAEQDPLRLVVSRPSSFDIQVDRGVPGAEDGGVVMLEGAVRVADGPVVPPEPVHVPLQGFDRQDLRDVVVVLVGQPPVPHSREALAVGLAQALERLDCDQALRLRHGLDDVADDLATGFRQSRLQGRLDARHGLRDQTHGLQALLPRLEVVVHRPVEDRDEALHLTVPAVHRIELRQQRVADGLRLEGRQEDAHGGVVGDLLAGAPVRPLPAPGVLAGTGEVERIEGAAAAVPDEERLAVLVQDARAVLRIPLPVAEPRLEGVRPNVLPQVRGEPRGPAVRR